MMTGTRCQALVGADVSGQLEAVHAWHFDVDQHDVRDEGDQLLERVDAILGSHDLVTLAC
jgi:hypothetical protein